MTTETSKAKPFDVSNYQIGADAIEEREITIPETHALFNWEDRYTDGS